MENIFKTYKLKMIQEEEGIYDVSNRINNPYDIQNILNNVIKLEQESEEVLYLLCLDTKNKITSIFEVSRGSLDTSIVHPREVFKRIITANASKFILAHNHPSGDCNPSKEDIKASNKMNDVGKFLGITMLDFVIMGNEFYSFREKLLLN